MRLHRRTVPILWLCWRYILLYYIHVPPLIISCICGMFNTFKIDAIIIGFHTMTTWFSSSHLSVLYIVIITKYSKYMEIMEIIIYNINETYLKIKIECN